MKDRYDIFGGLPDTIEDDWIENVEKLEEMMDEYIHLRDKRATSSKCGTRRPSTLTRTAGSCVREYWRVGTLWTSCEPLGEVNRAWFRYAAVNAIDMSGARCLNAGEVRASLFEGTEE